MKPPVFLLLVLLLVSSCKFDDVNPNAATEELVLTTKDGLMALCIGIRHTYSTAALHDVIMVPAITTREVAIMNTFRYLIDLETGGVSLNADNTYVYRLWSNLLRVKGMTEKLITHAASVPMDPGTRTGMQVYGRLFRAMCLGYLAQTFTHVPLINQEDGQAAFASGEQALEEAIVILEEAVNLLKSSELSAEFTGEILKGDISLMDCVYAHLARYQLQLGNFGEGIEAAIMVNPMSKSVFQYDSQNLNPIYQSVYVGVADVSPRDNFGVPFSYEGDGRKSFYLKPADQSSRVNTLPIEQLAGFFDQNEPLPVYLPGEMLLIQAEAWVKLGDLAEAVEAINQVRTKSNDVFGVNALLGPYTGNVSTEALLNEIYYNRCAELYLTGARLSDSRRLNRPAPLPNPDLTAERNRNFYPFPRSERLNNLNTPVDPPI